ncbi:uncharacterized protein LOC142355848 [Convolutriloba macropyga]|uniref:uncharacterized protein LOC142355848 n=1 Tax=Convolutriloba macropyga TaxID=536237 RepID=UPI003F522205
MSDRDPSPGLATLFIIMGALSVIGCLIYLYCFFFLQTVHSYARKLIAFIAFTEGMCILGNVSGIVYMITASESTFSDFGEPGYPYNCTPKLPTPASDQFCQVSFTQQNSPKKTKIFSD